jgi:cobalt-zinc-cadmium resistance protein CzcA
MKNKNPENKLLQIINYTYEHSMVTLGIAITLGAFGIFSFTRMNIDAYPDISQVQVQIISEYQGKAAEDVEKQVTIPIERAMSGIGGVEVIRSRSIFGLSLVQILFEPDVNDYFARSQVFERIPNARIPNKVSPRIGSLATAYGEIFRYELVSEDSKTEMGLLNLRTLHDWIIIPHLLRIKGVADVANFGGLAKQYAVHLNPDKMLQYGVKLEEIVKAIKENNSNGGGSIIERGSTASVIRGLGRVEDYKELENIFIKNSFGTEVFVRDIGIAVIDHLPRTGVFGKDKTNESIEGIIRMRRGENPSIILNSINQEIKKLNLSILPKNITIKPFYDRTVLIQNTLETVAENTLIGIILVILTLLLFLGNLRMALLVSITIPFSLLFALGLMYLADIPISLLSVGSIDFGIIVDGAVIISENAMRNLMRNHNKNLSETILNSAKEVLKPMLFSMMIVILAYTPLLSLSKIEGLLFRPMAITLCFALLGALLFAIFVIPVLIKKSFANGKNLDLEKESFIFLKIQNIYDKLLPILIRKRKQAMIAFLIFFFFTMGILLPRLGSEFLPYMDEGNFWLRVNFPEGISISESSEFASIIRSDLLSFKEIDYVTSQTGRNDLGSDPFPMNRVEFMIGLKKKSEWINYSTKNQLETGIRSKLKSKFPTIRLNLTQPIMDSVTEDTNGTSADLAIDIMGDDMDTLRSIARKVVTTLKKTQGAVNVNVEQESPQSQLQIKIEKEKLSRYRLSADNVNDVVNTALGGLPISEIYEGEKLFDIIVKYAPEFRNNITSINFIPIFNQQGEAIPLGQVASIKIIEGETIIARAKNKRRITVRCDIRNRSQGDFVKEAKKKFLKDIKIPTGYNIEWLGMYENLERARDHFLILVPFTFIFIFIILNFMFRSPIKAGLMILCVPFAMTGSVIALYIRGMHLSVSSGAGLTTLFGIATMHGILLISNIMHLQESGMDTESAVLNGAKNRLRPVLMTAFVAFIGLLPASLSSGIGSDIQRPIATVMVWGIFSSAFLTLILLPLFYITIDSWIKRK